MTQEPITRINIFDFLKSPAPVKHGVEMQISREQLTFNTDLERRHTVKLTPPSNVAWNRYHAAVAAMKVLEAYEGTEWGGPDYGTEVREPEPTREVIYTETEEEWKARCKAAGLPGFITYVRGDS